MVKSKRRKKRSLNKAGFTLAVFLTSLLVTPMSTAALLATERTEISDGYVIWGIKESWREYIGDGYELSDGVEAISDEAGGPDTYRWPIISGTYDDKSKTTVLKLGGKAHFTKYCLAPGQCMLDSTFQDLSLEISPDKQVLSGTYIGIARDTPGAMPEVVIGDLATLEVQTVDPTVTDGVVDWKAIPSVAGEAMVIYGQGEEVDPVTIHYRGSGGKPILPEKWDEPGAPLYEHVSSSKTTNAWYFDYYATSDNANIVTIDSPKPTGDITFSLLDGETLNTIGTTIWSGGQGWTDEELANRRYGQVAWDSENDRLFFFDYGRKTGKMELHVAKWNDISSQFEIRSLDVPVSDGTAPYKYGGKIFAWDEQNDRLLLSLCVSECSENMKILEFKEQGGVWQKEEHPLTLPDGVAEDHSSIPYYLGSFQSFEDGCDLFFKGTLICRSDKKIYNADGTWTATPALVYSQNSDRSWSITYLKNSIPPKDESSDSSEPYSFVTKLDDQTIALTRAGDNNSIRYITDPLDSSVVEDITIMEGAGFNKPGPVARDNSNGFDLVYSYSRTAIAVFRDKEYLGRFKTPNLNKWESKIVVMKPGSAYMQTIDGDENKGIDYWRITTTVPSITIQPQSRDVVLADGAVSDQVAFTTDYTAQGETAVQWQKKVVGGEVFEDIDGAIGKTLTVDATLADDGVLYRAVLSSKAGKVSTDQVTLTVKSTPRFAAQPEDASVAEGESATFTAPMDPEVEGTQTWQVKTGEGWVTLETGDGIDVKGDTLIVLANEARQGAVYRSVLTNDAGENISQEVTLTVTKNQPTPKPNPVPSPIPDPAPDSGTQAPQPNPEDPGKKMPSTGANALRILAIGTVLAAGGSLALSQRRKTR